MPFSGGTFNKLYTWNTVPRQNQTIFGNKLESEFGGIATGLSAVSANTRERLTANRTYYVRTDGSDINTGLVNSAAGAFLTLQKAFNVIKADLDLAGFTVTVQMQNATFTTGFSFDQWTGAGAIIFDGGGGTISRTNADAIATGGAPLGGSFTFQNVTLQTTTGGNCVHHTSPGKIIQGASVTYGACAGNAHITADVPGAFVLQSSNYTISGSAARHILLASGSRLQNGTITVTLSGTPAWGVAYVDCRFAFHASSGLTFSGSATGPRYTVTMNGVLNTNGGGANYFPGNSAGSSATGGAYI